MDYDGVHVSRGLMLHAMWQLYPAAMHSEVQFICPAMHGGGAKRATFEKIFETRSSLKYISNLGYKWKKNSLEEYLKLIEDED